MSRLILVVAIASILLIGCSPMKDRQEHAHRVVDRMTDVIVKSIEKVKSIKQTIAGPITNSTQKVEATTTKLQDRANQLQDGAEKVTNALTNIKEGVDEVKGALNVSGADGDGVEEK